MGMFDTVNVPCPNCETVSGFQSKGGDCSLAQYDLHAAPADVLSDVNRHAPNSCENCETLFKVSISATGVSVVSC